MSEKDNTSKQQKIFIISLSVFELEDEKGHLNWKVTELVDRSKISRSLIYRYFGGNKEEILGEAVRAFVLRFYCLEKSSNNETFIEKVQRSKKLIEDYPQAAIFYQRWRNSDSFVSEIFKKTERDYQNLLKKSLPHLNDEEILALHTCLHGFVTAPFLDNKILPEILLRLIKSFKSN